MLANYQKAERGAYQLIAAVGLVELQKHQGKNEYHSCCAWL